MRTNTQTGMAFIWVLLAVSVVSIAVMQISYSDVVRGDRLAYEKTLAQIHSIMNLAYAYRVQNGDWPTDRGDCLMPEDYIPGMIEAVNGWGNAIEGVRNCRSLGDKYVIQQIVPRGFLDRFSVALDETVRGVEINPGSSDIRMVIELHESMVDEKKLHFSPMANNFDDVATIQCPVGMVARYVVGVDGACGTTEYIQPGDDGSMESYVDEKPTFIGFNMGYQFIDTENATTLTFNMDVKDSSNYRSLSGSDLFNNASKYCPNSNNHRLRKDINVMIMSWCEPQG